MSDLHPTAFNDNTAPSKVYGINDRCFEDEDAATIHRSRNQASQFKPWTSNRLRPLRRVSGRKLHRPPVLRSQAGRTALPSPFVVRWPP